MGLLECDRIFLIQREPPTKDVCVMLRVQSQQVSLTLLFISLNLFCSSPIIAISILSQSATL